MFADFFFPPHSFLKILKEDMELKRRTLDQLSDAGQDVMALLRSPEAGGKIEADTEELAHRWDSLVQKLEDCSFQVCMIDGPIVAICSSDLMTWYIQ